MSLSDVVQRLERGVHFVAVSFITKTLPQTAGKVKRFLCFSFRLLGKPRWLCLPVLSWLAPVAVWLLNSWTRWPCSFFSYSFFFLLPWRYPNFARMSNDFFVFLSVNFGFVVRHILSRQLGKSAVNFGVEFCGGNFFLVHCVIHYQDSTTDRRKSQTISSFFFPDSRKAAMALLACSSLTCSCCRLAFASLISWKNAKVQSVFKFFLIFVFLFTPLKVS